MAKDEEQKTEVLNPVDAEQTSKEPEMAKEKQVEKDKKRFSRTTKIALVVAAIIAALLACVCIGYMFGTHETSNYIENQATEEVASDEVTTEEAEADANAEEAHVHNWGPNYVLQHVEAVTHTVEHPAVWEPQTSYHTVCNTCMQVIDGQAAQHIAQSGHQGYSTNVPITGDVMVSDAWTETVVDEEAHDELVLDGEICSECGATRNTSN